MTTTTKFVDFLQERNAHPRDNRLQFDEKWHKYSVTGDKARRYKSVTKIVKEQFPEFNADLIIEKMMNGRNWNETHKYWGMTPRGIKALWNDNGKIQSGAGTALHFDIEQFMNQWLVDEEEVLIESDHEMLLESYNEDASSGGSHIQNTSTEWTYFTNFVRDHPHLTPFRTEWRIYDEELQIAGSVDMIYLNEDGTYDIYDWKRVKEISKTNDFHESAISKHLPDIPHTNFWHYSLQLNIYKYIIERKYGAVVRDIYLVQLHPESGVDNYHVIQCADMQKEVVALVGP
jgi:ATP-dependent exoDNAse (exonuclease V) beta subunit